MNRVDARWSSRLGRCLGSVGAVLVITACASPGHAPESAPLLEVSPAAASDTTEQSARGKPTAASAEIPEVPEPANVAGPAASQVEAQRPSSLVLPSGTTMRVRPVSTSSTGELAIPADTDQAGWWDGSSKLGEPYGATVLVGHVDSFEQGLGRFAELLDAQPGDVITLNAGAQSQRFEVKLADLVPKTSLSSESELFDVHGGPRVVLITCGGAYLPDLGGYQDNMVVIAEPMA